MLQNGKILLAKGVRSIGSVLHFSFQTSADLVLTIEAKSLDKLDVYDLTLKELKQARTERTKLMKYKLKHTTKTLLKHSEKEIESNVKKVVKVQSIN